MDVSENSGTPKSSILKGYSINFTIHSGLPLFLETPKYLQPEIYIHFPEACQLFWGTNVKFRECYVSFRESIYGVFMVGQWWGGKAHQQLLFLVWESDPEIFAICDCERGTSHFLTIQ